MDKQNCSRWQYSQFSGRQQAFGAGKTIKKKLDWYNHVFCYNYLPNTILKDTNEDEKEAHRENPGLAPTLEIFIINE